MAIYLANKQKEIRRKLIANFEECTGFQSPHISHMDFLHQQLMFLFFLSTPHIVGEPLESLWAGIEYVAFWSEAGNQ